MPEIAVPKQIYVPANGWRGRVLLYNGRKSRVIMQFRADYEEFWQTPRSHGSQALSMREMQATLDQNQIAAQIMLSEARRLREAYETIYPEALQATTEDGEPLLPERYRASPYNYTFADDGRMVLESLKPEWEAD